MEVEGDPNLKSKPIVRLTDLPLPPSINNCYSTIFRGKKPIRIKSRELRAFENQVFTESKQCSLKTAQELCQSSKALRLRLELFFAPSRLYTLDNRIKKLDISNRIKAAEDVLCNLLNIDDSKIFEIYALKCAGIKESMTASFYRFDLPNQKMSPP